MYYRVRLIAEHIDGRQFKYQQHFESECALRIGSHAECQLQLEGRDVVSFHLSLAIERTSIRMIDLGSPAGVWLDNIRLTSAVAKRDAECRIGPYTLRVTIDTAGLGEAEESEGDLEVAQWHCGQIRRVWYAERRLDCQRVEHPDVTIECSTHCDEWSVEITCENDSAKVNVGFETVFTTVGPYMWSFRQVSSWQPAAIAKRTPPHPLWLIAIGLSVAIHSAFATALMLTPTPIKETSLVALEEENRFAKLFLEDIKKTPQPTPSVDRERPKPPPKIERKPKERTRVDEAPETVKVRQKRRLKRKRREKGLAEAMAALGGGSAQERALLDNFEGLSGLGDGTVSEVADGNEAINFDDWLASMKPEEADSETQRRQYQVRIEGQIAARKGDLRRCLDSSLLKRRGEVRVEVAWSIQSDGRLSAIRVTTGMLKLPRLQRCLLKELKSWRLIPPPLGKPVELSFPVVFRET